jgi:hypothetical protein
LGLEKIVDSLAEQLPAELSKGLKSEKERLERLGMAALSVFGLGLLSLLLYLVGYKVMITQGKIMSGLAILGFLILIGCGLLSVILFAQANEVKEAAGKRLRQQPRDLIDEETTKELLSPPSFHPITSVTDRTTDLLLAEQSRNAKNTRD